MSGQNPKISIPKILIDPILETQTETLEIVPKRRKLTIGVPKETTMQEHRVALVPASVATIVAQGHKVMIESGAGIKTAYPNHRFTEVGAEIAHDKKQVFESDIILKSAPFSQAEVDLVKAGQILFSPLHIPTVTADFLQRLQKKRAIALAMEYIKDQNEAFPIVSILSEIAGISAVLTAAELLNNNNSGKGVLLGSVAGVPPAKIVILGAGVVAEHAVRAALGLGAEVRIFDNDISKLIRLQNRVGRSLNTSTFNPLQLEKELLTTEVVIGAIHSKSGRTPIVVGEDTVMKMKEGSVIIDISIDQGGCFETSEVTTHKSPTFVKHGVIHYCVPNIASKVARTSSIAISNILTPILLKIGGSEHIEYILSNYDGLRNGVYVYKGALTNSYLGERFQLKSTSIDLLITSSI